MTPPIPSCAAAQAAQTGTPHTGAGPGMPHAGAEPTPRAGAEPATPRSGAEQPPPGPLAEAWGADASQDRLLELLRGSARRIRVPEPGNLAGPPAAAPHLAGQEVMQSRHLPSADQRLAELRREACAERGTPWPQPLVSHYARYFRDGNRTAYEGLVAARQQRLTRAVVMALAGSGESAGPAGGTDSTAWLDEAVDGAYLLCEQSSWSWPAHDDVFRRTGDVVPELATPYLDLGAGEVAAQLAWLDRVLGHQLDERAPGLRRRIRDEVRVRVIRPFLDRLDWHWLGLDGDVHNWNPWIHSNLAATALFLVDDPREQAQTVFRCIQGLDRFLASLPADGAIDEGFAYWWNGAGRALEGLALLEQATGGVLDAGLPVVRELVAFPHRMHIGGPWFLNVADGPAQAATALPWNMLHRWAVRLGDRQAADHAASMATGRPDPAAGLGRVLHSLLGSPDHREPARPAPLPPLAPFSYLPSVQVMLARETGGSAEGLLLAAKGGHNGEHHNHRDVGSVVVAVDGIPLLVDAGQPTYTAQTFGPDRYGIRAMQSHWHSVPAPFGLEQGTGREFGAVVLTAPTPDRPRLELALGGAYGFEPRQWTRTAALDRGAGRITIADRWDLPAPPAEGTADVDITFLTAGTVSLGPDGTATVCPEGIPAVGTAAGTPRGAALRWDPAAAVVRVDEWHLDDPLLADVWGAKLTRLRFRPAAVPEESPAFRAAGAFTLTVEATP